MENSNNNNEPIFADTTNLIQTEGGTVRIERNLSEHTVRSAIDALIRDEPNLDFLDAAALTLRDAFGHDLCDKCRIKAGDAYTLVSKRGRGETTAAVFMSVNSTIIEGIPYPDHPHYLPEIEQWIAEQLRIPRHRFRYDIESHEIVPNTTGAQAMIDMYICRDQNAEFKKL